MQRREGAIVCSLRLSNKGVPVGVGFNQASSVVLLVNKFFRNTPPCAFFGPIRQSTDSAVPERCHSQMDHTVDPTLNQDEGRPSGVSLSFSRMGVPAAEGWVQALCQVR
jgi:hypothetical protein